MGNIVASAKSAPPPDDFNLTPELGMGPEKVAPSGNEEPDSDKIKSFEELPRKVSYNFSC